MERKKGWNCNSWIGNYLTQRDHMKKKQGSMANLSLGYPMAVSRHPVDVVKKKVAFSQSHEIRVYQVDLRYNDEAFILTARQIMAMIKNELNKKEQASCSWLPSFFRLAKPNFGLDEKKLDDFKEAFDYRMGQLPESTQERSRRVDHVMREFKSTVQDTGWPIMSDIHGNKIDITNNTFPGHSDQMSFGHDKVFHTEFNHKRCEVEMLAEKVRTRIANDMSVETLLSEIKNLNEKSSLTTNMEMRQYCLKEIQTMKNILEDLGYIRSQAFY